MRPVPSLLGLAAHERLNFAHSAKKSFQTESVALTCKT